MKQNRLYWRNCKGRKDKNIDCYIKFTVDNYEDENGNGIFEDSGDLFKYIDEVIRTELSSSRVCSKDWKFSTDIQYRYVPEEELYPDYYLDYWDKAIEDSEEV